MKKKMYVCKQTMTGYYTNKDGILQTMTRPAYLFLSADTWDNDHGILRGLRSFDYIWCETFDDVKKNLISEWSA